MSICESVKNMLFITIEKYRKVKVRSWMLMTGRGGVSIIVYLCVKKISLENNVNTNRGPFGTYFNKLRVSAVNLKATLALSFCSTMS